MGNVHIKNMRKISKNVLAVLTKDPLMKKCMRKLVLNDHECRGRITFEHALLYAGRQVDEVFAIISLCAWAHSVDQFQDGGGLDKRINEWIAVNRMKKSDERRYPKRDWQLMRSRLNGLYGLLKLPKK